MICQKTKIRQVNAQAKASMRVLQRMGTMLEGQLNRAVHPIFSLVEVKKLLATVQTMDTAAHSLCEKIASNLSADNEAAIRALLESAEGEKAARAFCQLWKDLQKAIDSWDEGRSLSRQQIEKYEPTPLTLRHRTMSFQFTALCRQAEAHHESLWSMLHSHDIQFWVWDDKFQFSGQKQTD